MRIDLAPSYYKLESTFNIKNKIDDSIEKTRTNILKFIFKRETISI